MYYSDAQNKLHVTRLTRIYGQFYSKTFKHVTESDITLVNTTAAKSEGSTLLITKTRFWSVSVNLGLYKILFSKIPDNVILKIRGFIGLPIGRLLKGLITKILCDLIFSPILGIFPAFRKSS
jgi:hypothetical protein